MMPRLFRVVAAQLAVHPMPLFAQEERAPQQVFGSRVVTLVEMQNAQVVHDFRVHERIGTR